MDLLRRNVEMSGSVYYRGTMQPRLEEFSGLTKKGFTLEPMGAPPEGGWVAKLSHPKIGEAMVVCMKQPMMPPPDLILMDPWLSEAEQAEALACGSMVSIRMQGRKKNILRDRKNALRMLAALMGGEGVVVLDHSAQRFWSREELKEELSHNADLDIQSLYTTHMVTEDGELGGDDEQQRVIWYHTHGLAELGIWDVDILEPADVGHPGFQDHVRVLAFAMLDGQVKPGGRFAITSAGEVELVDAKAFQEQAAPKWSSLRDDPGGDHVEKRVVLCDRRGGRLLGMFKRKVQPAGWLRREMDERALHYFTKAAGELMASRAVNTYKVMRRYAEELEPLEAMTLVKIGYMVDNPDGDQREFLWFQVHRCHDETVDATLMNQPFNIARMKEGDRDTHRVEDINDWMIMTPLGPVTPRFRTALRCFRENREEILQLVEQAREKEA